MQRRHTAVGLSAVVLLGLANIPLRAESSYFDPHFKTSTIAILCMYPFNLKEAAAAVSDAKWLRSLNCFSLPVGLPVIRIQPDISSFTEPWQVRVQLPSGEGVTLWGYHFAFTKPNGDVVRY